ncbi:MAG TPA: hypothetical protein VLA72_23090, partial [Anaerolineales bacterium]|nr:hypothetical protein [Anaerolineales bacterium]
QRKVISTDFLESWSKSLLEPENSWKGSYADEGLSKAFHNTRNFLRSVLIAVKSTEDLPDKEQTEETIFEALTNLKPF